MEINLPSNFWWHTNFFSIAKNADGYSTLPITIRMPDRRNYSVTVIICCRNEAGNIEPAVRRIPPMGRHTEILFIEGGSRDNTRDVIRQAIAANTEKRDIKLITETADKTSKRSSKGDALRQGLAAATGEILMVEDGDLTVPPEDLPKFYEAIATGRGQFINGTRMVQRMERGAMQWANRVANWCFGKIFSWLLKQRLTDTLCGTKVLFKRDYERIVANRHLFGDFDPFGDFDLLFGAAHLGLKIVEVPVKYLARTYGTTNIHRWRHGVLLTQMCWLAFKKRKLFQKPTTYNLPPTT